MKKKTLTWGLIAAVLSLSFLTNASGALKAGTACSKAGSKSVSGGKSYTCVKSGKKMFWDKGVLIPVAKPAPSASASAAPVAVQVKEGDSCEKMGVQGKDSQGLLECRKFAGNVLKYIRINNDFSPVSNPKSPDSLKLCQLPDLRTEAPLPYRQLAIAYPPKPFSNFPASTGNIKVVVVGIDFPDTPGKGSPADIWKDELAKASQWMKWYTNDKVKLDYEINTKWLRAPKKSASYDAANLGDRSPTDVQSGGLTGQQISDDYVHTIEDAVNLKDAVSIWIFFPTDIKMPSGAFNPQSALVQTKAFGLVKSQLVAGSADAYLSQRPLYAYYLHEMIHGLGMQGHSPKFIPTGGFLNKNGMMSNADGWTQALLPWDSLVWGVAKESDIYCIDKPKLTSVDLKLVPLEREQQGLRSAIIKLNDHQALIVESHRSDKWGVGEGAGFAGTMVAIIDTTVTTYFESDDSWHDPCVTSTGVYLTVDGGNHGTHSPIGKPLMVNGSNYNDVTVYNGFAIAGDRDPWDLNHIMYPGESISTAGVKISLIKGGDNDTVRIENVNSSISEYIQPQLPASCADRYFPFDPNTKTTTAGGFRISKDLTAPTGLKISTSGNSANLSWTYSSKGTIKVEFFRVQGVCTKAGTSCGSYMNDIWSLPSSEGAPMSLAITQQMLGNPPSGGEWKFSITASNQSSAVTTAAAKFDTVTIG